MSGRMVERPGWCWSNPTRPAARLTKAKRPATGKSGQSTLATPGVVCLFARTLQAELATSRSVSPGRMVLAGLVAALVLFSTLASISDSLHQWLHADHLSSSHQCVLSNFNQGQLDLAPVAVTVPVPPVDFSTRASAREVSFVSSDVRLLPGRGPPCLS